MALVQQEFQKIDATYTHTDEKEHQNLMSMTGNNMIKGWFVHEESAVDIASLVDGAGATQSITVNGVALGDIVTGVSFGVDLVDMTVTAYVQSADTVEIRVQNESTATVNLAATTVRLIIADMT